MQRLARLARGSARDRGVQVRTVHYTQRKQHKTPRTPQPSMVELRPLDHEGFVWPKMADIVRAQVAVNIPDDVVHDEIKGCFIKKGCIWIPREAHELRQRILIVAHCGSMGHRGTDAMTLHLKLLFWFPDLTKADSDFLKSCVLCPHVKGGGM